MNIYKKLYAKDNQNVIREWRIGIENQQIIIQYGQYGGVLQTQYEDVPEGKASRSRLEQIQSRMDSRINSKIDAGYVENLDEARSNKRTNAAGFLKPMLAQKFDNSKGMSFEKAYVQYKYDGNRCLITNQGGNIFAYSRNGKLLQNLDHIVDDINLPEGCTIDGELYCHGVPLQTIVSWVKRYQPDTRKVRFHAYDLISDDTYFNRIADLMELNLHGASEVVPTWKIDSFEEMHKRFLEAKANGYEGAIIRLDDYGYEDGKRSKGLIKVKSWLDDEFAVTDIIASKDNWAILECAMPGGKSFRVSAPGTMNEKRHVLNNRDAYIFKTVRVEYAQLTKDGIPFHPVATNWRNKNAE